MTGHAIAAITGAALSLRAGTVLHDARAVLTQSFFMLWDTLWALILGFSLSGAVQAFVPRQALREKLGSHRPAAIARASAYGMASSSCSYAAAAMAKSLFAKGADLVAALVFMFASTNLVIELGVVLVVLMGWQFAAAEFAGGAIMIVLLAALGGLFLAGRRVAAARARLGAEAGTGGAAASGTGGHPASWGDRLRSRSDWAGAASYAIADLRMLRKELLVGFLGAGALAVLVPASAWNAVFLHGHGVWTSVENAIAGPFIALISFVCSIGNVPLAAALWKGGISFGGVVSFLFADLIALPLVLVYRKYYGGRLALRMLVLFWAVMSAAGLATEAIFRGLGLVPVVRPAQIVADRLALNYTTVLNVIFLIVLAVLYWLYRHRASYGGGAGLATDPVCGMQVVPAHAPASLGSGDSGYYFCSDGCRDQFAAAGRRSSAIR